jgi:hypothetical protein
MRAKSKNEGGYLNGYKVEQDLETQKHEEDGAGPEVPIRGSSGQAFRTRFAKVHRWRFSVRSAKSN